MNSMWQKAVVWRLAGALLLAAGILTGCSDCSAVGPVPTMEGTWAGVVSDTYACEGGSYSLEIDISGSTITVTDGTAFPADVTGTLTHQSGEAYTLTLDLGTTAVGQLYVDPQMQYGLLFVHTYPGVGYAYLVGILQKGTLGTNIYDEGDLVGDWEGVAARVNSSLEVTWTSTSTATVYESAGAILEGTDGDGDFSGILYLDDALLGTYGSGIISWPLYDREALGALSLDKKALAIAFLTSDCEYSLDEVITDQTFTLWLKQ